jgi:protein-S-isoprenylcysteine O-methyltransferase Ste14
LNRLAKSGHSDQKGKDKNTLLYLWISILLSITFGVFIASGTFFPIFENQQWKYAGLVIIACGVILRFISVKQLGKHFTVDVTIRKDHELYRGGFYKYLRHPSYSASLISFIGFGVTLNNWLSLIVVFSLPFIAFLYRMKVEEKVLIHQFGDQYLEHIKKTKRLIPFLY